MALGILLALCTSVCWAFGNVFIQKSGRLAGGVRAMIWALLLGALFAGAVGLVFDTRPLPVDRTALWSLAVAGVFGLLAYALMFYAFSHAKLTLAVPFVSSWSLVAGAISLTVMGERVAPIHLLGAMLVVAGVLVVSVGASQDRSRDKPDGPDAGPAPSPRRPLLAAFGSGVAFGVMVPALDRTGLSFGSFGGAALVYVIGLVLAVPLALAFKVDLRLPPRSAWGAVLGTGLAESLGFVCLAAAGRFAPVALVAPLASLAATLTVLYAWIVLREQPPRLTLLGAMIASSGVVAVSM